MKSSSIAQTFWDAASIKMKDEVITAKIQNSNRTTKANESQKRQKKCNWKDGEDYPLDQIGHHLMASLELNLDKSCQLMFV